MNRVWPCGEEGCDAVFDTEDAAAEHYHEKHPIPEADDSFYDDESTIIVTITKI